MANPFSFDLHSLNGSVRRFDFKDAASLAHAIKCLTGGAGAYLSFTCSKGENIVLPSGQIVSAVEGGKLTYTPRELEAEQVELARAKPAAPAAEAPPVEERKGPNTASNPVKVENKPNTGPLGNVRG